LAGNVARVITKGLIRPQLFVQRFIWSIRVYMMPKASVARASCQIQLRQLTHNKPNCQTLLNWIYEGERQGENEKNVRKGKRLKRQEEESGPD